MNYRQNKIIKSFIAEMENMKLLWKNIRFELINNYYDIHIQKKEYTPRKEKTMFVVIDDMPKIQ